MNSGLDGQVVLITGSSRGIGAATARLASEYGARVVLHGKAHSDHLSELAKELDAPFLVCDVGDAEAVSRSVAELHDQVDQVHALVNSAGMVNRVPFLDADDAHWEREFRVNLLGTVHFCQSLAPRMAQHGYGRIVNVGSMRGIAETSSQRGMAYSATKAAVHSFTAALAKELAPHITVNAVAPGFTETDQSKEFPPAVWEQVQTALVGRIGQPREIAELILFLASEKSGFITGQTIIADGGYSLSGK